MDYETKIPSFCMNWFYFTPLGHNKLITQFQNLCVRTYESKRCWGTLQIRIWFVKQRGNQGKPWYPLLPWKQTNICKQEPSVYCSVKTILHMTLQFSMCDFLLLPAFSIMKPVNWHVFHFFFWASVKLHKNLVLSWIVG